MPVGNTAYTIVFLTFLGEVHPPFQDPRPPLHRVAGGLRRHRQAEAPGIHGGQGADERRQGGHSSNQDDCPNPTGREFEGEGGLPFL